MVKNVMPSPVNNYHHLIFGGGGALIIISGELKVDHVDRESTVSKN